MNRPQVVDDVDIPFKNPLSSRSRGNLDFADEHILIKEAPLKGKLIVDEGRFGKGRHDLIHLVLVEGSLDVSSWRGALIVPIGTNGDHFLFYFIGQRKGNTGDGLGGVGFVEFEPFLSQFLFQKKWSIGQLT